MRMKINYNQSAVFLFFLVFLPSSVYATACEKWTSDRYIEYWEREYNSHALKDVIGLFDPTDLIPVHRENGVVLVDSEGIVASSNHIATYYRAPDWEVSVRKESTVDALNTLNNLGWGNNQFSVIRLIERFLEVDVPRGNLCNVADNDKIIKYWLNVSIVNTLYRANYNLIFEHYVISINLDRNTLSIVTDIASAEEYKVINYYFKNLPLKYLWSVVLKTLDISTGTT